MKNLNHFARNTNLIRYPVSVNLSPYSRKSVTTTQSSILNDIAQSMHGRYVSTPVFESAVFEIDCRNLFKITQ